MFYSNHLSTWIPVGVTLGLIIAYGVRVGMKGRARYERVDRQGGGLLLSKALMEMAYWGMQPLAKALVALRVSANGISGASLLFGGAAGFCLAIGNFGFGGAFAAIAGVLDALDGMVARLTDAARRSGKMLDSSIDRYVEFFFIAGLVHYYRFLPTVQWIALFALLGSFMVSYSTALGEIFHINLGPGAMRRPERLFYLIMAAILSPVIITSFELVGGGVATTGGTNPPIAYPMVLALSLIAVVANLSAISRLRRLKYILDSTETLYKPHLFRKPSEKGFGIGLKVGPGGSGPVIKENTAVSPHAPE